MNFQFPFPGFLRTIVLLSLFTLPACEPVEIGEIISTPTKMSLEEELAEEERAAEFIATARAEKTLAASWVSPYVEISNEGQSYLAFWFPWNDEHVLLPINEIHATDLDLLICQLDSEPDISAGVLIPGMKVSENDCVLDKGALKNAPPIIEIPGYFNDGLNTEEVNIIDQNGEYAENLADILTFVIKNDLLGSGDLTLNLYPVDGPNGEYRDDSETITYTLPAQALQVTFTDEQIANFEYVEDAIYALGRKFTWQIPPGHEDLDLSVGDENWFVLVITESGQESMIVYIQIKGVGSPKTD